MGSTSGLRPSISVVIPVKDRARLLAATLRSVREQSASVDEVIVVDDGSSDESAEVARGEGATVLSTGRRSQGPAAARNLALAQVQTEFAVPLDSDDLLRPQAIERLADALRQNPQAPFAFGRAFQATHEEGEWAPLSIITPVADEVERLPGSLYVRNFVPSSGVAVRTRAILDAGGYPEWLAHQEDHYIWIEMARGGMPVSVPELLNVTRTHVGGRHDPLSRSSLDEITDLADRDARLLACRPERLGVLFLDMMASAVHARSAREVAATVQDLLVREPKRLRILRSAYGHWRRRRRLAAEAQKLWGDDAELRAFLERYR